eukprot:COSAG01_NODE_343_length_18564_cov_10.381099_8_plen_156_part_00
MITDKFYVATGGDGEQNGYRHRRTTTAVTNSLLYVLNKHDVELIEESFPDLKHKLADHAEDYEKSNNLAKAQTGIAAAVRASKLKAGKGGDTMRKVNDPIHKLHEHLQQQDGKMAALDLKLHQQEAKIDRLVSLVEQLVPQTAPPARTRRVASRR